jgi:hypothetical protein
VKEQDGQPHVMFNASEIRALLTAKNFMPFAIHTSDGGRYEISKRDMMLVSRDSVSIGVELDNEGIAQRFVRCSSLDITRIEHLRAA